MSKLKGLYLLFGPYEYKRVCQLALEHDMTINEYIHWLLSFEIIASEDEEVEYYIDPFTYSVIPNEE